jgi:DNA sulfur modification protein DndC
VPGGQSWCTEDWKIAPMRRALSKWTKETGMKGDVLKLTGTRFSESQTRGRKITERGESATRYSRNHKSEAIRSPIADLSADEVWTLLGYLRAGLLPGTYSDLNALFRVYEQAGGTSCAVVANERFKAGERG